MELEVGKTYVDAAGRPVLITGMDAWTGRMRSTEVGAWYNSDGKCPWDPSRDLVREALTQPRVVAAELKVGSLVYSELSHERLMVQRLLPGTVIFRQQTGHPLPLTHAAIDEATWLRPLAGSEQADQATRLRAVALNIIEEGKELLALADRMEGMQ